jgi:hypothetical protein
MGLSSSKNKEKAAAAAAAAAAAVAAAGRTTSALGREVEAKRQTAFELNEKKETELVKRIGERLKTLERLKDARDVAIREGADNETVVATGTDYNRELEKLNRDKTTLDTVHNDMDALDRAAFLAGEAKRRIEYDRLMRAIGTAAGEMVEIHKEVKADNTIAQKNINAVEIMLKPSGKEPEVIAKVDADRAAGIAARANATDLAAAAIRDAYLKEEADKAARIARAKAGAPQLPPGAGMAQAPSGQLDVAAAKAAQKAPYGGPIAVS